MALIRQLAWMSRMIYFRGKHHTAGWTRVGDYEAFCGFCGAEFHRSNGSGIDIAICFRGTQFYNADYEGGMVTPSSAGAFIKDVISDVQLLSDQSASVIAAREYAMAIINRTIREKEPSTLILTGHSLGASLAQSAVVVCPPTTRVITFCTPLVSLGTQLMAALVPYNKILNIVVKGDPVTDLAGIGGRAAIGQILRVVVKAGRTGIENHDMEALAEWITKAPLGSVDVSATDFDPAAVAANYS